MIIKKERDLYNLIIKGQNSSCVHFELTVEKEDATMLNCLKKDRWICHCTDKHQFLNEFLNIMLHMTTFFTDSCTIYLCKSKPVLATFLLVQISVSICLGSLGVSYGLGIYLEHKDVKTLFS